MEKYRVIIAGSCSFFNCDLMKGNAATTLRTNLRRIMSSYSQELPLVQQN